MRSVSVGGISVMVTGYEVDYYADIHNILLELKRMNKLLSLIVEKLDK